ncbi:MAG: HlyD family efflux transporter periplasmic adaptor subunit [Planctomycetia bacterium]|nr:HlyD family efflux transporter periplasmic adaptor subunit [Planctomycetia bacterium]
MKLYYRHWRVFSTLVLCLLVACTAGAIFALNPNGHGVPQVRAQGEQPPIPATLVCYGNIDVEPGVIPLFPLQPGRITEVLVKESQAVKKGQPLLKIDDQLAQFQLQRAEADLQVAESRANEAKKLPQQHQLKLDQQRSAVEAGKHKLAAARHEWEQKKELVKQKLANERIASAAEELTQALGSALEVENAKLKELELFNPQAQVLQAGADVKDKQAQLDKARYALQECTLTAPADGMILQVLVGPGNIFSDRATQPVMVFVRDGARIVRAEVEQEFASRLAVGQPVTVQDEFGNGGSARGKVSRMAAWYTRSRSQAMDPMRALNNEVRTLECIIALDSAAQPFRLGQRVRVTVGKAE